ncbi:MAG: group II intron reverse transcriptase/maturase [Yaniella sp.]|uniref:group II intron reverse transcriptase/maturase n=2 Tax=Yaniella sp. TaxID=2773929 RepID=UPI0026475042|nr:group II intron reverse transcriptase/maturase [Yaniella sp.]MDN5732485.1 group II intron reverse transcriptase/maturase [Yaniella sp.]MDN5818132.1 group II intron reverse transcriptase/maturase [Yaniella sp.]MDN5838985.1 group II intron reverse transcriptase/maturase [Yaniella sp.]MDN6148447.1 group II intron reverse transcriptase/maturase [Yaniella sp.]MDN6151651.1 group II intron reverse transcriptase/maturase [Yaniella sp.]
MSTVITKDGPVNTSTPPIRESPELWVSQIQAKLHHWATTDPSRRFDDVFNLVHDPTTLYVAWQRVATNRGARSAGSDGLTATMIAEEIGVSRILNELREQLKTGTFRAQPVRERKIPKPGGSGKLRRLGIPTIADRVVQAAVKMVLEPIFEADFLPVSYGFRPKRRAHDAIAEIHMFGTHGYRWVLDADIEACFDRIDHTALMGRVRARIKDKRVLRLVKGFLKAGIPSELGDHQETYTGTPQGGILSPVLANVALSVLDEYLHAPWQTGQKMSTNMRRTRRRWKGLPNWRIIRYADDFVVLTNGSKDHLVELREEINQVLSQMGFVLSEAKTQIVHMSTGFEFLGFHLQWAKKQGTKDTWHVYTFIAPRAIVSVKQKIRDLTRATSQQSLKDTVIRLNRITRGWSNYFRHAVAKHTFRHVQNVMWWRIVRWQRVQHRWNWQDVRRWLTDHTGRWRPISADGIALYNLHEVPIRRYRYRGNKIPAPF